jgi:hypothetical protein
MTTDPPGWLPAPVQDLANAAVRAGLVPLVQLDDDQSVSLRGPGDADLALLAAVGTVPFLILSETEWNPRMEEWDCVTIEGREEILAWIATAAPTTATTGDDRP